MQQMNGNTITIRAKNKSMTYYIYIYISRLSLEFFDYIIIGSCKA